MAAGRAAAARAAGPRAAARRAAARRGGCGVAAVARGRRFAWWRRRGGAGGGGSRGGGGRAAARAARAAAVRVAVRRRSGAAVRVARWRRGGARGDRAQAARRAAAHPLGGVPWPAAAAASADVRRGSAPATRCARVRSRGRADLPADGHLRAQPRRARRCAASGKVHRIWATQAEDWPGQGLDRQRGGDRGARRSRTRTRASRRSSTRIRTPTRRDLLAIADPLLVALDEVTDPQNLGAIARTAEAAGATGVIIPERRSRRGHARRLQGVRGSGRARARSPA